MSPEDVTTVCPACAEDIGEAAALRCRWCGERLEREEIPSDGFGTDSLLVAAVCVVGTLALMGWAFLLT